MFKIYTILCVRKMLKSVKRKMVGENLIEIKNKSTFSKGEKYTVVNVNFPCFQHINIDNIFDNRYLSFQLQKQIQEPSSLF